MAVEAGKYGWDHACHVKKFVFYSETNAYVKIYLKEEEDMNLSFFFLEKDCWQNEEDQFSIIPLASSNFMLC